MIKQQKFIFLFLLFFIWFLFLQFDCHSCKCWSCQYSQCWTRHYASHPDCSGSPYPGHQFACCCWLAIVSCADLSARCRKRMKGMLACLQCFSAIDPRQLQESPARWSKRENRHEPFDKEGNTESSFSGDRNCYRANKVHFYEQRMFLYEPKDHAFLSS